MVRIDNNKILLGNSLEIIETLDDKPNLILTDPPQYRLINKNIKLNNRKDFVRSAKFDYFTSYSEFKLFTSTWIRLCTDKIDENGVLGIWFAEEYAGDLINICKSNDLKYFSTFYWHKTNPMLQIRKRHFLFSIETCLFFTKGKYTFNFLKQNEMHNFMELPICLGKERLKNKEGKTLHPTQKPLKLINHFIKIFSNIGDKVLDLFTGTGTTNVACKMLNRKCLGIESNEEYYLASIKRLKQINTTKSGVLGWF